jgi:hypothetical protein
MKNAKLKKVRGSGNVFRNLGHKNADAEQFKAILAAEIIKALDREGLSVRAAHGRTGIAAADFSRIRNAALGRFTLDRLMSIITGSAHGWRLKSGYGAQKQPSTRQRLKQNGQRMISNLCAKALKRPFSRQQNSEITSNARPLILFIAGIWIFDINQINSAMSRVGLHINHVLLFFGAGFKREASIAWLISFAFQGI